MTAPWRRGGKENPPRAVRELAQGGALGAIEKKVAHRMDGLVFDWRWGADSGELGWILGSGVSTGMGV